MPRTCPSCGAANADDARFCSACGTALSEQPAGRKERKFATALFADVVGSTTLAEREDPEVVQSVVGRTFDRLSREIERYGGLIEKFMGDAVLALFGVPTAHEDDPERAVRAALEMQGVLAELNRDFVAEGKPQLAMRVGIEAGEVLVDLARVEGSRDRMVTGDAINVAARLQAAAEPGTVVVGPTVYEATKASVEHRPLGGLTLKGKSDVVDAYVAVRLKARTRGERPALGLQARLIGRDEELSVLTQTLNRIQTEARPSLVTILGAAGVGKTRLVHELFEQVEARPDTSYWRTGRCYAYGNLSYSALAEAVKAQCEILEDDSPAAVEEKAGRAVEELFGDRALTPHLLALVGGTVDAAIARDELFDAWRRFLERMAARYPLVLVLEDIHWADDGLLDFIDHLADWAQGPLLILTIARPELLEKRPAWGGGKRNYAAISLDPLTPEETAAMLDDLLEASLPAELKRTIIERSEGNPLFSEELVRMFIDRGVLQRDAAGAWAMAAPAGAVEVPHSIHALIAARLDSLPVEEKATVQDASVAGRVFWVGSVASLSGRSREEARAVLGRLRLKEIVLPHDPPVFSNEIEFSFRHSLIRDVAYDSLPKTLRADKHVAVARWAEEQAGERSDEISELLATHYTEALRYLDELGETNGRRSNLVAGAYRWARAAGERSYRLGQSREAIRWLRAAEQLSGDAGISEIELATLRESLAEAMWTVEPFDVVVPIYKAALSTYDAAGMTREAGRVEARLGLAAFMSGRDKDVLPLLESALARLEMLGDTPELARTLFEIGNYLHRRGFLRESVQPLRRSIEIAERVGDRVTKGHALQSLCFAVESESFTDAEALMEEAYAIAQETGDVLLRLRTATNYSAVCVHAADGIERGKRVLEEAIPLARRTGHLSELGWLTGNLGDIMREAGRLPEAIALQEEAVECARIVGDSPLIGMRLQALADAILESGDAGRASRILDESEDILKENPEPQGQIMVPLFRGTALAAAGRLEEAAAILREGVHTFVETAISWGAGTEPFLVLSLVKVLVRLDRTAEAVPHVDLLQRIASGRVTREAIAVWARGLVETRPEEALRTLSRAAEELERLGRKVDLARCLIDRALAEKRLGSDPAPTLARAEDLLEAAGARLYLSEVEAARAELRRGGGP